MPQRVRFRRPSLLHLPLRRHASVLILLVFVPVALLQAVVAPLLMMRRFSEIEQQQALALDRTVERNFRAEETRLRAYTKNFATWSETYRFAERRNPGYLTSNLVPSTFEGGNVSVWGIADTRGAILSAAVYPELSVPVSPQAGRLVGQLLGRVPGPVTGTFSGVAVVDGRFYLLAAQPVTRDDGSGLAGRMLLARELSPAALRQVVSVGPESDVQLTAVGAPRKGLRSDQLLVTVTLPGPDGGRGAALEVVQARPVMQVGRQAALQNGLITLLCGAVALVCGLVFFRGRVLRVVDRYDAGVQRMKREPAHRLQVGVKDELGRLAETINDLTDQHQRQHAEIQFMHQHDRLTGLLNRGGLARTAQGPCRSAVALQVSGLESLTGLYGAAQTDRLMIELAARLREQAPLAWPARLRSDTFALISDQPLEALRPALRAVGLPYAVNTGETQLRFHVGLVENVTLEPAETLLECAELALQEAHEYGELTRTYTRQTRARLERRQVLRDSLRRMTDWSFTLNYQPVVALRGQVPVAFEALLRWEHPQLGFVSPAEFIPLAERGGHIYALGQWVIREAALDLLRSGHPTLKVNVNVSPLQLLSPTFAEDTLATVREAGLTPDRLTLEVTESAVLEDLTLAITHLNTLRVAGFRVALDDFGAGYSSLSLLSRLPVDILKLDRTFLTEALTRPAARTVLTQTVLLARELGFPVVAEGIENVDTLTLLRELGVTHGQGFLLGRPAPFSESFGRPHAEDC